MELEQMWYLPKYCIYIPSSYKENIIVPIKPQKTGCTKLFCATTV